MIGFRTGAMKKLVPIMVLIALLVYYVSTRHRNAATDLAKVQESEVALGSSNGSVESVYEKTQALRKFHDSLGPNSRGPAGNRTVARAESGAAIDPFPYVAKSRVGLEFENDPSSPRSEQEQAWLDRHGYPNAEQWVEYNAASDDLLAQAASNGDAVAEIMLNARRLRSGDQDAETALLYSAALGNTFALEMLSSTIVGGGRSGDPIDAYAFSRVAEMRGDLTLGMGREMFFPVRLDSAQRAEAEARALNYFNMLIEIQREVQGENATITDPRPITITGG